jgi:hypothetical protein
MSRLTQKRIILLGSICEWYWDKYEEKWEHMLDLLYKYVNEHGKLPGVKVIYHGTNLGTWCSNQRSQNFSRTTPERFQKLSMVPGWYWKKLKWNDSYNLLLKYIDEHGKLPKTSTKYHGIAIGTWIHLQRNKKKNGKMKEYKIRRNFIMEMGSKFR